MNGALVSATGLYPTRKSGYLGFFFENVDGIDKCVEGIKDMMKKYYERYEEARRSTEHSISR